MKNSRRNIVKLAAASLAMSSMACISAPAGPIDRAKYIWNNMIFGGTSIVYECSDEITEEDSQNIITLLQTKAALYGVEAEVQSEEPNRFVVYIPGEDWLGDELIEELIRPAELKFTLADGTVVMEGSDVESALANRQNDDLTGIYDYVVNLQFTEEGKDKFAKVTSENIGKLLMIVVDDVVVSAPMIREAITEGTAIISGQESIEQAMELTASLNLKDMAHSLKCVQVSYEEGFLPMLQELNE